MGSYLVKSPRSMSKVRFQMIPRYAVVRSDGVKKLRSQIWLMQQGNMVSGCLSRCLHLRVFERHIIGHNDRGQNYSDSHE